MQNKVILSLFDGMRPDAIPLCKNKFLFNLKKESTYCYKAKTVFPCITLPCHTSLFLGVDPSRHGVIENVWKPQVHQIDGIFECVSHNGGKTAMFVDWSRLRDLSEPRSINCCFFQKANSLPDWARVECELTDLAIDYIKKQNPDFVFMYYGNSDETGHKYGWMTEEYLDALSNSISCVEKIIKTFGDEYQYIITADHGGHERTHGFDIPEDMTIPITFHGTAFERGKELDEISLLDIAPTIASVMGFAPNDDWDGKSIL